MNKWNKINYKKLVEYYNSPDSSILEDLEDCKKNWQKRTGANLPTIKKEYLIKTKHDEYLVAGYDDSNGFPCFWVDSECYEPVAWMEFQRSVFKDTFVHENDDSTTQ